ncbi:unnamed protein product [Sphagnum troendelagicum]
MAATSRSGRPMGVSHGRSPPGPHLRPVLPPQGRRTDHPERQARKEASAVWQGELRRVRPNVARRGRVVRAHTRQATEQTAARRPAQYTATGQPADRPQLQKRLNYTHRQQHPEGHRAGHGRLSRRVLQVLRRRSVGHRDEHFLAGVQPLHQRVGTGRLAGGHRPVV